jgi:hypothetical protein
MSGEALIDTKLRIILQHSMAFRPTHRFMIAMVAIMIEGVCVFAQSPTASPVIAPTASSINTPTAAPTNTQNSAAASFDHVIELTSQLNDRLLATVYWCLGTLVGVFVLLVGFNWFTNFRIQQREVAALREELAAGLSSTRATLEQANNKIQQGLREQLQKSAETAAKTAVAPLVQRVDAIQRSIDEMKADFVEIEVDKWVAQKVYTNAIRSQITYLKMTQKTDSWDFNNGLDRLERIFMKAIKEESPLKPDAEDVGTITRFLTSIDADNPIVVARLRDLLGELIKKGTR